MRRPGPLARLRAPAPQVRVYDARGQARSLDPATEPGRTVLARAEELLERPFINSRRPGAGSP